MPVKLVLEFNNLKSCCTSGLVSVSKTEGQLDVRVEAEPQQQTAEELDYTVTFFFPEEPAMGDLMYIPIAWMKLCTNWR